MGKRRIFPHIGFFAIFFSSLLFGNQGVVDLRQLERIQQDAEGAMIHRDWVTARDHFRSLLDSGADLFYDPLRVAQLSLRLAKAEWELGELESASARLQMVLEKNLPNTQKKEAHVLLARVLCDGGEVAKAFATLKVLESQMGRTHWRREERALYGALALAVEEHYQEALADAEEAIEGGLYSEALACYEEVAEGLNLEVFPSHPIAHFEEKLRYRLGEASYKTGDVSAAIHYLTPFCNQPAVHACDLHALHLLGLAHKHLGNHAQALAAFATYLESHENEVVEWECALCYQALGLDEAAGERLERILGAGAELAPLAQVYLSQIDLATADFASVEERLGQLAKQMPVDDPLRAQIAYLRGEAALRSGDLVQASFLLAAALPTPEISWYSPCLYSLGIAYLQQGHLEGAEAALQLLYAQAPEERPALALARAYLLQGKPTLVEQLLTSAPLQTRAGQAEGLLLRALAAPSLGERQLLYETLATATYANTPSYIDGWLNQGIDQLDAGAYHRAAAALEEAYRLLKPTDSRRASQALKLWAQSCYQLGMTERACQLLTLLVDEPTLFDVCELPDEALYLLGLYASDSEPLDRVATHYADGPYAAPAVGAMGTLAYQNEDYRAAERHFLRLASDYPHTAQAGDAWYWAASCAQKLNQNPKTSRAYRTRVFEDYPNSSYAAQAYFESYPFADYYQGIVEALDHLRLMPGRFPDSPYLVIAYYLLGLEAKQLRPDTYTPLMERAIAQYERCAIPEGQAAYYTHLRQRALLEVGLYQLKVGGTEAAQAAFLTLATELRGCEDYPRILEEAEFGLAQAQIASRQFDAAESTLIHMRNRYKTAAGHYPTRVFYHLGRISMRRGDYRDALTLLAEADRHGAMTTDQQLDLWLVQSYCLQKLDQLDEAMRLLSRVINHEAASARRIEAMYKRAHLYARQGRHELAIRQLEATATKTGTWAARAREKLRKDYDTVAIG